MSQRQSFKLYRNILLVFLSLVPSLNSLPTYSPSFRVEDVGRQDVQTANAEPNNNNKMTQIFATLQQISAELDNLQSLRQDVETIKSRLTLNSLHFTNKSSKIGGKGKGGSGSKSKKSKSIKENCNCPPPITTPTFAPTQKPEDPPFTQIRILPLGDSLTKGQAIHDTVGAYRGHLYTMLTNRGYNVDYVGTQVKNSIGVPDKEHEGVGGVTISYISDNIEKILKQIEVPDVILLHVGTNDFGKEVDIFTAIDRYEKLISKMGRLSPTSNIIATSLIIRNDEAYDPIQRLFNIFIEDTILQQAAKGVKVTYLNMNAVVKKEQLVDGIHPNKEGYRDMATAWLGAIQKIASPMGDNYPPSILSAHAKNDKQLIVTMSKPIATASVQNVNNFSLDNANIKIVRSKLDTSTRNILLTTTSLAPYIGLPLVITIRDGVKDRTDQRRPLPKLSSFTITVRFTPSALPQDVLPANKVRIMPLGSTLTKGEVDFPGSYRKQVYQLLTQQGYSVDFVGSKVTNRFPGIDPHHEGTADKFITFFTRFAEFWLDKIDTPDMILLHVGIFDFLRGIDIANTPSRYSDLIQEIARLRPTTRIIATNLISKQGTQLHRDIQTHFNPFIEDIVKQNAANGILVNYLDIASFVKDIDVDEKSLLTQQGYDNMGDGWVSAIVKYMNPNGDLTSIPTVLKLDIPLAKKNEILVTFSKPISDVTAVKTSNYQVMGTVGRISINNAVLNEEKRIVILLTSSLNTFQGQKISVTVKSIVDRAGNRMNDITEAVFVPSED